MKYSHFPKNFLDCKETDNVYVIFFIVGACHCLRADIHRMVGG